MLICGGRNFNRYSFMYDVLDEVQDEVGKVSHVIVGGAAGADYWGEAWAYHNRIPFTVFKPDWTAHGKKAGPLRNKRMIDEGKPDIVVAFPGGRGTEDMIRRAEKAGIRVERIAAPCGGL